VEKNHKPDEEVIEVRRRAGKLRTLITSRGRRFLLIQDSAHQRLLEVGAVLSEADRDELGDDLARPAGIAFCFQKLARRDRSEWEIRHLLAEEGIEKEEVVDYIVGTLRRRGYIDDRRLACSLAGYGKEHRHWGPRLIARKLGELRVGEEIISETLTETFPRGEERECAFRLAVGRLESSPRGGRPGSARRMHGFLSRRGFSGTVVNEICARILRGEMSGVDDEQED